VQAGELVGHVGEAGAPGRFEGQVHVEIMSADELGEKIEPGFWHTVDGAGMGRFCSAPEIIDKIDRPSPRGGKDGFLSRAEVLSFYRGDPRREEFRRLATHHVSEWADENDWQAALSRARDFAGLPKAQRARLYKEQIEPVLWWNDAIGDAAGLPPDKLVWTYHPITFIVWIHRRQRGVAQAAARGIGSASAFEGKAPPKELKDDADATEGFLDDEDALFSDAAKKLELEDLAKGYPDE
jgi:hypothetical protein